MRTGGAIQTSNYDWDNVPQKPIVLYHSFQYRAASWDKSRRAIAKIEWHAGELFPSVGFIVRRSFLIKAGFAKTIALILLAFPMIVNNRLKVI